MTKMLASVTGADEARIAMQGGADIIDLKDPAQGALGAVTPEAIRDVVRLVNGKLPVSAVTGDLPMQVDHVMAAIARTIQAGAGIVKIGIFPGGAPADCLRALASLAGQARLVAVMFADRCPDLSLLPLMADCGFAGAMLDTANKGGGRLLEHMDLPQLRAFTVACRSNGLFTGLAGSLEAPDVPRLLVLQPDVLGFRGALCAGGRASVIDPAAVRSIRALIPRDHGALGEVPRSDSGLGSGYGGDIKGEASRTDHVFLRDWELPVRIGAYARERTAPQRVRFGVCATVLRPASPTRDMGDVFSYDIISDGIRMLTDGQHIPLVETLAERIAALVLAHPRVVKVSVTVEKLDIGTGVVGVTIERQRDDPVPPIELLFGGAFQ